MVVAGLQGGVKREMQIVRIEHREVKVVVKVVVGWKVARMSAGKKTAEDISTVASNAGARVSTQKHNATRHVSNRFCTEKNHFVIQVEYL